ncbi:putative FAD-dependent pyridine nucleotide-disulfide oxidoreductase [Sulfobacillus acidophilus TPY]|nr:putative FAD-dependent pyridine nucleotide-disulfide oxidoreductase [Sulfobacillus acidophilus TPY]
MVMGQPGIFEEESDKMHLVMIGGSDAGISAALRARELDRTAEITLVVGDAFPNFSICGLPFYLSGEISDWRTLAHRTHEEIESHGIRVLLNTWAESIDPGAHRMTVRAPDGRHQEIAYDRLVVATGAVPVRPSLPGLDDPRVFLLHSMEDSFRLHAFLEKSTPQSAVIVGAGYIGLEMADALTHRGIRVTLIEQADHVLPTVDPDFGAQLDEYLQSHGVTVMTGSRVRGLERTVQGVHVVGEPDWQITADLVLVVVGVAPDTDLAARAGIFTGIRGAIRVDRQMRTNLPDIWAAGDCVETYHRLLDTNTYLPLGTTAHKQGRVAGENMIGGNRVYEGSLGTQVVKVFDWAIGRTGLKASEARAAGYSPRTTRLTTWDHKVYYPGATPLTVSITGDAETGRLLGGQLLGHWQGQVAKRLDILAAALYHQMTVDGLNDLDLSYTPPLSSPWDPVQMAAQQWITSLGDQCS